MTIPLIIRLLILLIILVFILFDFRDLWKKKTIVASLTLLFISLIMAVLGIKVIPYVVLSALSFLLLMVAFNTTTKSLLFVTGFLYSASFVANLLSFERIADQFTLIGIFVIAGYCLKCLLQIDKYDV